MIDYASLNEGYSKLELNNNEKYATRKHVALATAVPIATSLGLAAHGYFNKPPIAEESIPVVAQPTTIEPPSTILENYTPLMVNEWSFNNKSNYPLPDNPFTSLDDGGRGIDLLMEMGIRLFNMLAEPIVNFLVAISFPVASVILVSSFFVIMFGMKEKAFSMMINCGIGYALVQASPFLLKMFNVALHQVMVG